MFSYIWSNNSRIEQLPDFKTNYVVNYILPVIWLEHCMECAMPLCYRTCGMFEDRGDGRCRRFENGTQLYQDKSPVRGATIEFRRWAKLEAVLRKISFVTPHENTSKERCFNRIAAIVEKPCHWLGWSWHRPSRLIENYFDEQYIPYTMSKKSIVADLSGLYIVAYNHENASKTVHFELKQRGKSIFHTSFTLTSGWNENLIDVVIPELSKHCLADIYIDNDETAKITFRYLDFVNASRVESKQPAKKVKCVAWDLDNTIWEGVIGDDGPDSVKVRQEVVEIIKSLDERGIIQTVVSKNEFDIAWNKLKDLSLDQYFLYPAINWGRKSQNLQSIAKELNINIDTFAVLDDSEFERNEISNALPQVRVYDSITEINSILNRSEFDVPVTEDSRKRRLTYQIDSQRKNILASWSGSYDDFLSSCEIQMEIFEPVNILDQQRCLELIQRSNQYNLSRDRRSDGYIQELVHDKNKKALAYKVSDKFGNYGIVGFCSFEISSGCYTMKDFVMSCRVAQKHIEKTILGAVVNQMNDGDSLIISLEKTDRNAPLQSELKKLPFEILVDDEYSLKLKFIAGSSAFNDENIIKCTFK